MKWKCLLVLLISFFCSYLYAKESDSQDQKACVKIRSIQIDASDVYEDEEDPDFFESTLNFFHFTTRTEVVQEELLFQEGDCLDKELTTETARNLRSLPIFSEVFITVSPIEGSDDVDILPWTRWT